MTCRFAFEKRSSGEDHFADYCNQLLTTAFISYVAIDACKADGLALEVDGTAGLDGILYERFRIVPIFGRLSSLILLCT